MASTYSTSLRLELMATGDQSGTWGDTTNTNLGTLIEQAITGYLSKAMADANQTLTNLNGASDEARNMIVEATGALTAGRNIVVPTAEKLYLVRNNTSGGFAVTVKTSAGSGVAVPEGGTVWVYCDGTDVVRGNNYTVGSVNGAVFTDPGATVGPIYDLFRDSSSPAASDILGRTTFNGRDSAGNKQEYGSIEAVISDPTSTSEDGALDFYATVAGTRTRIMSVGPNLDLAAIGQIKFPASQNASSNANTLDDYEEGTSTPAVSAGSGTLTTASATLSYTKIGNRVAWNAVITITTNGSGATSLSISLPFTPGENASCYGVETGLTGKSVAGVLSSGSANASAIRFYDATYPGGTGAVLYVGGTFKV